MVASLHDRVEHTFLAPHFSLPIADTHEVFMDEWVTFQCVDWTVMLAHLSAESEVGFNLLSLVDVQNVALLRSDEELLRTSIDVVFHGGTSKDFGRLNSISIIIVVGELMLFDGCGWLTHIPPEYKAIGGG